MSTSYYEFEASCSSDTWYVKRTPSTIYCTCPSWRYLKPNKPRGCKHCDEVIAGRVKPISYVPDMSVPGRKGSRHVSVRGITTKSYADFVKQLEKISGRKKSKAA